MNINIIRLPRGCGGRVIRCKSWWRKKTFRTRTPHQPPLPRLCWFVSDIQWKQVVQFSPSNLFFRSSGARKNKIKLKKYCGTCGKCVCVFKPYWSSTHNIKGPIDGVQFFHSPVFFLRFVYLHKIQFVPMNF